jgi:hypothetical protein
MRRLFRHLFVLEPSDRPLILLGKLARRPWNRTLYRKSATYDGAQQVFILRKSGDRAMVTPQIAYENKSLTPEQTIELAGLQTQPLRLWLFLREHSTDVTLCYRPDAPLPGPWEVDTAKLTNPAEGDLVTAM